MDWINKKKQKRMIVVLYKYKNSNPPASLDFSKLNQDFKTYGIEYLDTIKTKGIIKRTEKIMFIYALYFSFKLL